MGKLAGWKRIIGVTIGGGSKVLEALGIINPQLAEVGVWLGGTIAVIGHVDAQKRKDAAGK